MAPLYREGDRVIVDRDDATPIRRGDRVVVRTRSGQVLAKEVGLRSAAKATLVSINPAYAPIVLNGSARIASLPGKCHGSPGNGSPGSPLYFAGV